MSCGLGAGLDLAVRPALPAFALADLDRAVRLPAFELADLDRALAFRLAAILGYFFAMPDGERVVVPTRTPALGSFVEAPWH